MSASSSFSSLKNLLKDPFSPKPKFIYGFPPKNDAVSDSDDDVSLEGNVSDTYPSLSDDDLALSSYKDNGGIPVERKSSRGLTGKRTLPPPPINCLNMAIEGKRYVYACYDKNADRSTEEVVTIPDGDLLCANRDSGSLKLYFNKRLSSFGWCEEAAAQGEWKQQQQQVKQGFY